MKIDDSIKAKAEKMRQLIKNTMPERLGIELTELSADRVSGRMPVNKNTVQPMRMLHGGASVALAETLMSIGAWLNVDEDDKTAVGMEINANHIRPVEEGSVVIATAIPIHLGKQTQIWETRITTEDGKLVSVSRCTIAVVKKKV